MRIMAIPDTHGSGKWRKFVDSEEEIDKIVFLGDYVDSFDATNEQILENLADIIYLKRMYPQDVILLLGNHELSYYYMHEGVSCSGFRPEIAHDIRDMLIAHKDLFQNAYQHNKTIFTHAGIQEGWFKFYFKGDRDADIAEQLNNPKNKEQFEALRHVGRVRGGIHKVGGIFWIDRRELKKPLYGYTQVVGHSPVKKYTLVERKKASIYFIDCLERVDKPFIIDT